ncbi:MAG: hypothetical protein AB1750_05590 [Chloroflexota bacterium]
MSKFFLRVFRLQPGEGMLVFALGFLLFGNSLARQVSGIVAVSGFLSSSNVNDILLVLLVDYTLILVVAGLQSLIVDRFNRIRLMGGITLVFTAVFVGLRLMFVYSDLGWLNYSAMYLVAEQQLVLFPITFWVLANDVFSFAQAQRLIPLIASWSFVGKLAGIGVAGVSPALFQTLGAQNEDILLFNAFIYFVGFILVLLGLRNVTLRRTVQKTETMSEALSEGWGFVRDVASFRYLMIAILGLAIADTIIEFRFLVITDAIFVGQNAYQSFYSLYRLAATLISFIVQTFLTSRLIKGMQLKNVFYFFPIVALLASGGMLLSAGLYAAVAGMLTVKLMRETVDDSARKAFQALVPEERRGRVSTFNDSYLPAIGTILACILTGAVVLIGLWLDRDLHLVYLTLALLGAIMAIWATNRMAANYDTSMLNWRLKRRQRVSDSMFGKLEDL